ncbi:tetratricopeptide repeat protein [Bradyrhizobium sp. dw_78]|uniref:tetratricopeptide repeat protein n=1 Tax=Bradyrhizobium sp. dw_78 TaxID=2719793 RepID=UPI001BD45250|nr:tetratricopeptide repeat protein [Bradyrhizobium sp. dw_78]
MDRFDLGSHTRTISTASPEAQRWFDIGLNWCFAFNKSEGVKCFRRALEFDPECVMAHWGVAYGCGPFYNMTWRDHSEEEANNATRTAYEHIQIARALTHRATELENWLVETLACRVQKPHSVQPEEFDRWDDDYAAELRRVYHRHPDDQDVVALFVEALITRTPRRLWNARTGRSAKNSDVIEALEVCERAIGLANREGLKQHPALLHLHIHILETSNEPERATVSAVVLATMCPDAGHMNHMPAHVHVLCGDYQKAKIASVRAIAVNDKYLAYAGALTPYTTACAHDLLLMMHACMFMGRYGESIGAANKLRAMLTKEVLSVKGRPKFSTSLEGYYSMSMHVMVRFGRWQEIVDAPMPDDPELYLVSTAMCHYAKGVAYAALKQFHDADRERRLFHDSLGRIPHQRKVFNNTARSILGVGEKMLDGELEYHKSNHELGYAHLREAVDRDDNLEYVEPWAWMHPPRHALAALLAEQGHYDEAEQVYRDDLGLSGRILRYAQHPDNVWALHGLAECLRRRGEAEELAVVQEKLAAAISLADVPIMSSCMCRMAVESEAPESCCAQRNGCD